MTDSERVGQLLQAVLAEMKDPPPDETTAHDFVFHLVECTEDLQAFVRLLEKPGEFDVERAKKVVQSLLYHASGHIAQAARLYDYFPDPFGRGAEPSPPDPAQ